MNMIEIKILRCHPDNNKKQKLVAYSIHTNKDSTILEGLLRIYERNDSTLAFSYGCRLKNCGLCAVNANGRPCYACLTRITDGMTISPLKNLPVIKDLVIDRRPFFQFLTKFKPYVVRDRAPGHQPEVLKQPDEHTELMACRECFGCMSLCPKYDYKNELFGGPLGFVKLAQLHYDVRDSMDRVQQAKDMGISNCIDCMRCACLLGIPINKIVIRHFLESLGKKDIR
jgi:succinate dehydrogenase / fumarate reductase iron-sulfur subunit